MAWHWGLREHVFCADVNKSAEHTRETLGALMLDRKKHLNILILCYRRPTAENVLGTREALMLHRKTHLKPARKWHDTGGFKNTYSVLT